jgi:UPF0716 family protein affecting phage T7 exclusion
MFAEIDIDWGALGQVIWISAVSGIFIATVLGVGIVSSLRAADTAGNAVALRAVTVISVAMVAAALVTGIYFIADK